ncbi:hypothetical protein MG293_011437 [Ovis ammon polii]|nr:hypothetical protein MG293_011437 [Ovis ammon polii]
MSSLQRYRNGHIHDCQGLAGNTKSVFQSRGQVLLTVLRRKEYKKSQMSKQKDEVKAESMGGLLGRREKFGSGPGLQTCMAVCGGLSLWPGDSIPDVFKKFSVKMSGEEGPGGLVGASIVANGSTVPPDSPLEDPDPKDTYLIPRNIMAEPDYIDDDNPELIRPQKLVNPVKTSRNHQDLHRELLMNQKRGLAPQNKPELQKVMEKRKRDQVIKQKEEEAQKKKSDLEIELLKRQQKLEQLELEKQKLQEEQENAPEFVKVKGNLRRTGQEVAQAQES